MLVPASRALAFDYLYFGDKRYTQPLARDCDLGPLHRARKERGGDVAWSILFLRAHAILCTRHDVLLQTYFRYPWPGIYQHDEPIGSMMILRKHRGEDRVFAGLFRGLVRKSLADWQHRLDVLRTQDPDEASEFRGQLRMASLPWFIRRPLMWAGLNITGWRRARSFGTFGLTSVGATGAISMHPPSIHTSMLTYGPIDASGKVRVTMVYDHRLMDGIAVGEFLAELEKILNHEIIDELRAMPTAEGKANGDEPGA